MLDVALRFDFPLSGWNPKGRYRLKGSIPDRYLLDATPSSSCQNERFRFSTLTLALLALFFAWGVEFSQLYHAPWVDAIRSRLAGKLVLGNPFYCPDLAANAVGVGGVALVPVNLTIILRI